MSVTLENNGLAVAFGKFCVFHHVAGIRAETQRASLIHGVALIGQKVDNFMFAIGVEFARIRVGKPADVSRELDHRDLHTEADPEIGDIMLPRIFRRDDFSFDPAVSESARDENTVRILQNVADRFFGDRFAVRPEYVDFRSAPIPCVAESLRNGKISVVQGDVFPDDRDIDLAVKILDPVNHARPFGKVGRGSGNTELTAHNVRKMMAFKHQRRLVQHGQRDVFDHAVFLHVAEKRYLVENAVFQRFVATKNDNIGINAHSLQFLYGMLGGFALVLVASGKERNEGYVDEKAVFSADFEGDLSHRLEEGLRFDIADRSADLRDHDVRIRFSAYAINEIFDLVRDVRNGLNG